MPGPGPWRHHHKRPDHVGRGPQWQRGGRHWPGRRHFLFVRFMFAFGSISLLLFGAMGLAALLLLNRTDVQSFTVPLRFGGCTLALASPLVALWLGRRLFRRTVSPIADLLAAVQSVGEGDLTVRVDERGGEYGQLGHAFNNMATELALTEQKRRNLTADIAHELRTPLHIIQGNLEGVLDGVYSPDNAHIEATLEETQRLARLVDDLQTLSLAEEDQLALVWEDVIVAELLADVVTSFSGQAEAAGISIRGRTLPTKKLVVPGDTGRLNQVLSSLVMNALRHTPAGGKIELAAAAAAETVQLTVSDTGQGIPAADLPYIFDRFWRGDRSRQHGAGVGAGLGLAIARQLVRAHDGRIEVASTEGAGTIFTITLPAARVAPQG